MYCSQKIFLGMYSFLTTNSKDSVFFMHTYNLFDQ